MGHKKVMKDKKFININNDLNNKLTVFPKVEKLRIFDLINKDSLFLRNHSLMDYSMLLVVEHCPKLNKEPTQNRNKFITFERQWSELIYN